MADKEICIPSIAELFNIYDFHAVARKKLLHSKSNKHNNRKNEDAYNFYITGVLGEHTLRENQRIFSQIWLRPRILVGVSKKRYMDTSTEIFGGIIKSPLPLYISASTRSNLAHPNGEIEIIKAAKNKQIVYMIPAASSIPFDDIMKHKDTTQIVWYQFYTMNAKKDKYKKYVTEKLNAAVLKGIKTICLTVDSPAYSKRERYFKLPGNEWMVNMQPALLNPSMDWLLVEWIVNNYCKKYNIQLILKGIGCGEDVLKAYTFDGVNGVILSNHGGRQGEFVRSSIEVLIESVKILNENNIYLNGNDSFEIFVDGGIRRGTDIFKALCLGASMVGISRPIIYGLICFGQDGIEKVIDIFRNELLLCMQMMGVNSIKEIRRNMVVYNENKFHCNFVPKHEQQHSTYSPFHKL
eukprot:425465_1